MERAGIKYWDIWAQYGDDSYTSRDGGRADQLRRDLSKFKSLKEVLLSHNASDGGLPLAPGQTVLLDHEENRTPSPEPRDSEDEDEDSYLDPFDLLP